MRQNRGKCGKRWLWWLLLLPILVVALVAATQIFAHRYPYFIPEYPYQDLTELLKQEILTDEDYKTLFLQTGLGNAAVDDYLAVGETDRILENQEAMFHPPSIRCDSLGFVTREDHQVDKAGNLVSGIPMAPLEKGDVLLSFSTHTMGWRHGHAGLVVDTTTSPGSSLEAVLIGTNSMVANASHWSVYSTYIHLRLKAITSAKQEEISRFAMTHLNEVPYHLTSGVFGPEKSPEPGGEGFGAQCAYLVWYALEQAGFDIDSDGGRIVTVADIAASPLFEVVQVYGIDPRLVFPPVKKPMS